MQSLKGKSRGGGNVHSALGPCCRLQPLAFRMGPNNVKFFKISPAIITIVSVCNLSESNNYKPKQFYTCFTSTLTPI